MKKRILCAILSLIMLMTFFPVSAFAGENMNYREVHINPIYKDVVTEADIISSAKKTHRLFSDAAPEYVTSIDEAVVIMREGMENRVGHIEICCKTTDDIFADTTLDEIAEMAMAETGVPTQGDYIRWTYAGWSGEKNRSFENGSYYCTFTYDLSYYTTAEQEAELAEKIDRILSDFNFSDKTTEYEIICAVYDYICSNVKYDYQNLYDNNYLLKHTAYAAMMNNTAVCQGYAALMYRMLLQENVGCRLIPGNNHAWNIVEIDGLYYNVDSTWDAGALRGHYSYFLLCDNDFAKHTRYSQYSTEEFYSDYPMAETSYTDKTEHKWDDGVPTVLPTCSENGVMTFTCSICGNTKKETIAAYGHDYLDSLISPTCIEEGYTEHTCSACGDSYKDNYVNALGHKSEIKNAKAASCTAEGYTGDKVCKVCGTVVEQGKAVAKLAHSYQSTVIEPTTEAQGYTKHTCTKCGDSYMDNYTVAAPVPTISIKTDSGKPTLKWAAVDGAAKYEVYRATSKTGTYSKYYTTASTSYTNTSAVAGTTYYYKVKAIAANGNESDFSVIKSITCDCAQPIAKISTTASSGKPTLKWSAVDGATKYEVYRATSSTGTYTKYYTTTSTSYTNSSAVAGSTYYYKVKAICGKSSYGDSAFSAVKSITCDCAQPVVKLTNVASSGKIKISWRAITGATKYEVWRATSKTGTYTKISTTTGTSITNTRAVAGKTYYYKVKAICGANSSGNSAFSSIRYLTCDCARPVVKITTSSGHPKLSWAKVEGAKKYEVYRATSKDGTYTKISTTTKLSYTNTTAKAGKTYYYKVKAVCGASSYGNSAYSKVVSIKAK